MAERIPALKEQAVPEKRRGGKLLAIVIALFVIALVVLFFRSSLSRISEIEVKGTAHLKPAEVEAVLGVSKGDSFFSAGSGLLERRVRTLKAVESVHVAKRFPGKVTVSVQEYPDVAVELGEQGKASVVLSSGLSVPLEAGEALPDRPVLTGWKADDANRAALCAALGKLEPSLIGDVSQIAPDPSAAYPDRIKMYTRSRFEIVTTIGLLPEKVGIIGEFVENREPGRIVLLDADYYMPYSAENEATKTPDAP
ncbi:cell division protein FtsQ/DivIB [Cohnella zeiphila]|uniref:FtsQ-type POTRA domain-containing protein n=1 Tax=Cohnella zeiphila TaxID=2761120 RepID=A0A7X0SIZ5_9BACL|nr:FtsQ-type POTRA domain-containing protein [Cohnella zeiphila]MBB6729644.1 FtsQ-type POTRA domain-containing protein [Cohnella zeiphila]